MTLKSLSTKVAAGAAAAAAGLALTAGAAGAAGTSAGALTLTPGTGGSHTSVSLGLPSGAACSGDSTTAGGGYKVYSFLVPAATNPATLTFNGQGPSSGTPLYQPASAGGADVTAKLTNPGDGKIVGLPQIDFDAFSNDGGTGDAYLPLTYGDYIAGIACAKADGTGDKYWSTPLTFSAKSGDLNGEGFAPTAVTPPPAVPEVGLATLLPLSAAALAGGSVVVLRRRRRAA